MTTTEIDQLRDMLEVLKAGDVETAIEWLEAAIRLLEATADNGERLEGKYEK